MLDFPIRDNVTLASLGRYARYGLVRVDAEEVEALRQRDGLDIRAESTSAPCTSLSGGNQQKVVLAKWLSMAPRVLVLDEPTAASTSAPSGDLTGGCATSPTPASAC